MEGETKVNSVTRGVTYSPFALGDLTKLWAHRRGGFLLNASEIELSSLAIFTPPCFIFLAAAWEGWEGERDGGKS